MAGAAIRNGEAQARREDLQVFALDDALDVPGFALLDIYFLHLTFGQDIVGGVADVFRHTIVQESLAHFANDALFRSTQRKQKNTPVKFLENSRNGAML